MTNLGVEHLVGIDGGGSGCRAAVAAMDGRVLGAGEAGPANATTDLDEAVRNVLAALAEAARAAGLPDAEIAASRAHAGVAGALSARETGRIAAALPMPATVTDDRQTAARGALGRRDGILAAIGTGTLVVAVRGGRVRRVGGWGLQLSDEASGAWLGRRLLARVLLCHDGMAEPSALTERAFAGFGRDPARIAAFAASAAPSEYATHAPAVIAAADRGDAVGAEIVNEGARYLDRAIHVLGAEQGHAVCLAGGLGPAYARRLDPALRSRIMQPEGTALHGALALARASVMEGRAA